MVADNENKYEFPSFGNHLQKEAVTAASAARWEALVVCIRVWGTRPHDGICSRFLRANHPLRTLVV